MGQIILENSKIKIELSTLGAELQSLYSKITQQEYLWQPGGELWPHHSMLLFPSPGRIAQDRIIVGGKIYPAMMHGFVNDMEFEVLKQSENEVLLELSDTPYTQKYFPYKFKLQVEFSLEDVHVIQKFRVINMDEKKIYFSLGAHPGFYCPIDINECGDEYSLVFDCPQTINLLHLDPHTRLLTGEKTPVLENAKELYLRDHFFDDGPMLFEGVSAKTITLRSNTSGAFVEMGIEGFPYMCLWGPPGKMSLIAIEPWCGITDRIDTNHVWEHKPGIESIDIGETFERFLSFYFN